MIPNNFNRLLEMSVVNTPTANDVEAKERPLTEEDKNFLSAAMDSLCPDYVKILKDSIAVLDNPTTTHEQRVAAFQELLNHCDNLDVARDFEKLGGFRIIYSYIDKIYQHEGNEKEGILALDVTSMCCQLNDYCQERAIQAHLLSRTESLLNESLQKLMSAPSPIVAEMVIAPLRIAFKTLSVLSAIIRGSEASISSFLHIENGKCLDESAAAGEIALFVTALGLGELKVAFGDDEKFDDSERALPRRIRTKAAFLLRSLINKEESESTISPKTSASPCDVALKIAVEVGIVEKLLQIIADSPNGSEATDYEHVLTLLAWLCEKSADSLNRLKKCGVSPIAHRQLEDWKETAKEDDDQEMATVCDNILCCFDKK